MKSRAPSRVSITRSRPLSLRPSISNRKSITKTFNETVTQSPFKLSSKKTKTCDCKCGKIQNEYQDIEVERKQCPMCNSLLIKRSISPIRKSVENRLKNLDNFGGSNNQSVSFDTVLRASARDKLLEHKMIKSPQK